jgi:excisionase family DNA binding protein
MAKPDHDRLLTPAEVAAAFNVHPRTVTRWAKAGLLDAVRTLGGHRRFREATVRDLLAQQGAPEPELADPVPTINQIVRGAR